MLTTFTVLLLIWFELTASIEGLDIDPNKIACEDKGRVHCPDGSCKRRRIDCPGRGCYIHFNNALCDSGDGCYGFFDMCDGDNDCDDGTDEKNCVCLRDELKCDPDDDNAGCYKLTDRCDSVKQCKNNKDEEGCRKLTRSDILAKVKPNSTLTIVFVLIVTVITVVAFIVICVKKTKCCDGTSDNSYEERRNQVSRGRNFATNVPAPQRPLLEADLVALRNSTRNGNANSEIPLRFYNVTPETGRAGSSSPMMHSTPMPNDESSTPDRLPPSYDDVVAPTDDELPSYNAFVTANQGGNDAPASNTQTPPINTNNRVVENEAPNLPSRRDSYQGAIGQDEGRVSPPPQDVYSSIYRPVETRTPRSPWYNTNNHDSSDRIGPVDETGRDSHLPFTPIYQSEESHDRAMDGVHGDYMTRYGGTGNYRNSDHMTSHNASESQDRNRREEEELDTLINSLQNV
ncbi:unnamed protein product [Owenia fusiformis]|uniref:Uncharacterized protein n=1 Tax=Owenia fusiformis TaxID=6347 RepID=A0A8J1TUC8_OWEFU|nr:unnamed protein product [Owenia fusiformis]